MGYEHKTKTERLCKNSTTIVPIIHIGGFDKNYTLWISNVCIC
jgi:hypothetical protein